MINIIVKDLSPTGETRSKVEEELRKEGWGSSLTEEQIDKCAFLERQAKKKLGGNHGILRTQNIDKVK